MSTEFPYIKKKLTIITDPHIKVDNDYFVYKEGKSVVLDKKKSLRGAFIRDRNKEEDFVGDCWPERSVWVDFLSE